MSVIVSLTKENGTKSITIFMNYDRSEASLYQKEFDVQLSLQLK
jgi:hypothetical protein